MMGTQTSKIHVSSGLFILILHSIEIRFEGENKIKYGKKYSGKLIPFPCFLFCLRLRKASKIKITMQMQFDQLNRVKVCIE